MSKNREERTVLKRHRVGIVGLEPGRSWAALAHLPALRALKDDYEVIGVANRSEEHTAEIQSHHERG